MSKNQVNEGISSSSSKETKGNEKSLFVQVPLEVLEARISTSAMKLYMILLKYARQSNECWPSQQTLGWDMNLKPRRIADLLKELEGASLITIISRAKVGLSNLYRLLKVVPPKVGSDSLSSKTATPAAKKDLPGKQRKTGEGLQDSADESHAVEQHAIKTHIHMQSTFAKENQISNNPAISHPGEDVCDFRNLVEEEQVKPVNLRKGEESDLLHIPQQLPTLDRVISVLTGFGVSASRAKHLGSTVIGAKLDDEYVKSLAEWVKGQASSRPIYNPAGLLVQMVHQLAPVPLPKGVGVPTLNSLEQEAEAKREYFDKHLPRLIAMEERNLADAVSERDKASIRLKLDKYLALQAKEDKRAYPFGNQDLVAQREIVGSQPFFMEQS